MTSPARSLIGCQALVGLGDPPHPVRVWRASEARGASPTLCLAESHVPVTPGDRVAILTILSDSQPADPAAGVAVCRVHRLGRYRFHRSPSSHGRLQEVRPQERGTRTSHCRACGARIRSRLVNQPRKDCAPPPRASSA